MWTLYRHTKGMPYVGLGVALHSEDLVPFEVYRCLYDNELSRSWIRPQQMFHEQLEGGQARFTPFARVRVVTPHDEPTILGFGQDAWGKGMARDEFVASYASNRNHVRGKAYLLEKFDGTPVSALNTLRLNRNRVGIARVATDGAYRGQGYASLLLRTVMELLLLENREMRFILYSEVDPVFYEKLGFRALSEEDQHFLPAVAMISGAEPLERSDSSLVHEYF